MQHKQCFMAVHRTFTDRLGNDDLFGGIPMVLGGDFAQILPVVPRGNSGSHRCGNKTPFCGRDFKNCFCVKTCEFVTKSPMRRLRTGSGKCLMILLFTVVFSYRNKSIN